MSTLWNLSPNWLDGFYSPQSPTTLQGLLIQLDNSAATSTSQPVHLATTASIATKQSHNNQVVELTEQADALIAQGRWTEAVSCFAKAIRLNGELHSLYAGRARCELHLNAFAIAICTLFTAVLRSMISLHNRWIYALLTASQ